MNIEFVKLRGRYTGGHIYNGIYTLPREEKHLFRKYNGYGISSVLLPYLNVKGVKSVCFVSPSKTYYYIPLNVITKVGIKYQNGNMDTQYIIPLDKMHVEKFK